MNKKIFAVVFLSVLLVGCTSESTKLAQRGSMVSQAVNDGVYNDMFNALSRENYESAKRGMQLDPSKSVDELKAFAKKRDMMTSWDRDHERANTLKIVTVDSKLFSEIGILDYLFSGFSKSSQKAVSAYDAGKAQWNTEALKAIAEKQDATNANADPAAPKAVVAPKAVAPKAVVAAPKTTKPTTSVVSKPKGDVVVEPVKSK